MTEKNVPEIIGKGISLKSYVYSNPNEALQVYSNFGQELKQQVVHKHSPISPPLEPTPSPAREVGELPTQAQPSL